MQTELIDPNDVIWDEEPPQPLVQSTIDPGEVTWDEGTGETPATGTPAGGPPLPPWKGGPPPRENAGYVKYNGQKYAYDVAKAPPYDAPDEAHQQYALEVLRGYGVTPHTTEVTVTRPDSPIVVPGTQTAAEDEADLKRTQDERAAQRNVTVGEAFGRGWNDFWKDEAVGLDPDNPLLQGPWWSANRAVLKPLKPLLDIPVAAAEAVGAGFQGATDAFGQALYNYGLSEENPRRIGASTRELAGIGSLGMAPASPFALPLTRTSRFQNVFADIPGINPSLTLRNSGPPITERRRLADLANRYDVQLNPADVAGPIVKSATAGLESTLLGSGPIRKAATNAQDDFARAVDRVAGNEGDIVEPHLAGEGVKTSAGLFKTTTSQRAERLYNRAARWVGGQRFETSDALAELDRQISLLAQKNNPADPLLVKMRGLRDQLDPIGAINRELATLPANSPRIAGLEAERARLLAEGPGVSYEGLKGILSDTKYIHRAPDLQPLPTAKEAFKPVTAALERDADRILTQAGNSRGLAAWRQANAYWRNRAEVIEEFVDKLVAGKSGEEVLRNVEDLAKGRKGGVRRIERLYQAMAPEDLGNLRATMINRLGLEKLENGQSAFRSGKFFSRWNDMSPEGRRLLFGSDPATLKALDELAELAEGIKTSGQYANFPNTARALNVAEKVKDASLAVAPFMFAGGAGASYGGMLGALGGIGLLGLIENLGARALTSPALVRHLVRAKDLRNPSQFKAWSKRLAQMGVVLPTYNEQTAQPEPDAPPTAEGLRTVALDEGAIFESTLKDDSALKDEIDSLDEEGIDALIYGSGPPQGGAPDNVTGTGGPAQTGDDTDAIAAAIYKAEGTGKNPRSSADGPYQLTDDTFETMYRRNVPGASKLNRDDILKLRTPQLEQQLGRRLVSLNRDKLSAAGIEPNARNTYLAHFFGGDTAIGLLRLDRPGISLRDGLRAVIGNERTVKNIFAANPHLNRMTVGDAVDWADRTIQGRR